MIPEHEVTRDIIAHAAREILAFLRTHNVRVPSDLIPLHQRVSKGGRGIDIFLAPSNGRTNTHTIGFCDFPRGIPVEVKINPILGYSNIIIKGTFEPPTGYVFWNVIDLLGNSVYRKRIRRTAIPAIASELELLAQQE